MTKLHPDLRRPARFMLRGIVGRRTLPAMQWMTSRMTRASKPGIELVDIGGNLARLHRPPGVDEARPGLLWVHGGGYVLGSPAQDDLFCQRASRELGIVVAAISYRLAPQHPFPAALDDCMAGLTWLAEQPYVDASRLAVGGASAGGGLAAAIAIRARDQDVSLKLQLLAYPMIDDRTALRTGIDERDFRLWNNKCNAFGWRAYTGKEPGSADVAPLAAPARCGDLSGLAPAWIGVGDCDLFYDEDLEYAERLRAAGVSCDVEIAEGAYHAFDIVTPKASISEAFHLAKTKALAVALG